MQDSEECMDTAVVRAWLQANMPGLELLPATRVDVAQAAVLEGAEAITQPKMQHTSPDRHARCADANAGKGTQESVQILQGPKKLPRSHEPQ